MSDQDADHTTPGLIDEDMNGTQQADMGAEQHDDSELFGDDEDLEGQEDEFLQAEAQGSADLEAFAEELEEEIDAEERITQEAAMQEVKDQEDVIVQPEVAADTQEQTIPNLDAEMTQPTEEEQDAVMQTVEQDPTQEPELPALLDMDAQMPAIQEEQPQQHDPISLFVSERGPTREPELPALPGMDTQMEEQPLQHDPTSLFVSERELTPTAGPIAPAILNATPVHHISTTAPRPNKPFSFSRIREFQSSLQRLKAAGKKPVGSGFGNPLLNPAAQRDAYVDSILAGSSGTAVHRPIPDGDADEKADKEAAARYQRLKRQYDGYKKNKGHLTFREDVEWMKIQAEEDTRRKKRKRDLEKAREEEGIELFPEDRAVNGEEDDDDLEPEYAEGSAHKRRKPEMPRKNFKTDEYAGS